ncbi:hypothetical protein BDW75DRAFT_172149 [Aspergillus navahoensis]
MHEGILDPSLFLVETGSIPLLEFRLVLVDTCLACQMHAHGKRAPLTVMRTARPAKRQEARGKRTNLLTRESLRLTAVYKIAACSQATSLYSASKDALNPTSIKSAGLYSQMTYKLIDLRLKDQGGPKAPRRGPQPDQYIAHRIPLPCKY